MNISATSLRDRLKNLAKAEDKTVTEILKTLYLERFLARLSKSKHSDHFIFKGGSLLAYMLTIGRETNDLDFLMVKIKAEEVRLKSVFGDIAATKVNDGFEMTFQTIEPLEQPHMKYDGYRVTLKIKFIEGTLRDNIQVDVGIGDVVTPQTQVIELLAHKNKPFFEASLSLRIYPPEYIYAEKLETIVSKGAANSRMKDFHDLILMGREKGMLNTKKLHEAINKTFAHRGTEISLPLTFSKTDYDTLERYWSQHLKGLDKFAEQFHLPPTLAEVVSEISTFLVGNVEHLSTMALLPNPRC